MKKIILFLILFFPFSVFAEGTDKYYIEARILANGDMEVKELKILDGTYNGAETSLNYRNSSLRKFSGVLADFEGSDIYNASAIENIRFYGVNILSHNYNLIRSEDAIEFTRNDNAKKGDYGFYQEIGYLSYRVYLPSSYNQAFLTTYTLKDVVVVHNDVAEIAWDFISSNYQEDINELVIKVFLPGESNELRVFSHGPLIGYNKIISKSEIEAIYPSLYAGHGVDIRVVFDSSLVPQGSKKSNINGFEFIKQVEENRAKKANDERENAKEEVEKLAENYRKATKKKEGFSIIHLILTAIGSLFGGLLFYKKHDKEHPSNFQAKYYREFTGDYNVEVIDYLFHGSITANAMSASIMNLVNNKVISVEKEMNGRKEVYRFRKLSSSDNATEQLLLDFLFNQVGNGEEFTDQDLQSYAKSTKTYNAFLNSYSNWKKSVVSDGEKEAFWEKSKAKPLLIIGGILNVLLLLYIFNTLPGSSVLINSASIIIFLISVGLVVYVSTSKKRTVKGRDHYLKWRAFKNFLNDFGTFETKDLPEIILWEKYLVYATIFGLAERVQKAMNVKIKELNVSGDTYPTLVTYNNMHLARAINNSVNSAVRSAGYTASQVAASKASSSGGFGGGSSFGGGGFGGGGSGGGRF